MSTMKKIVYSVTLICSIMYLTWRGVFTLPFNRSIFELIYGILLLLSEILSTLTAFILIWNKSTFKKIPEISITSKDVFPDIDILIATHNEATDLLYKTINACTFMAYPDKSKVHIYLCDDSNRPEMAMLAKKFKINYIGLTKNKHAKAGNFNNALLKSQSPLVATFDADMIPYSNFLMTVVPYFFDHYSKLIGQKVGFVQTPQSFYNKDIFQKNLYADQVTPNEQDFFSKEINILNSHYNSAVYTGSNTLFLREAIIKAGYFPTNTLTEDFQLGVQINSAGYSSISTTEPMASGLTPTDIGSVFKQRTRWARGMIQSMKNLRLLSDKNLTWAQKTIFFNGYLYWWSFLGRLLFVFAPILFALFNFRVVNSNFWLLLMIWVPGYLLLMLVKQNNSGDITNQRWGEIQELFFAPYLVLPVILETIGIKNSKFKVTQKNGSGSGKKDWFYVLPHLIILILTIVSLIKFNYGKFGSEILYGSVITFWLLNNLVNSLFSVLLGIGKPIYEEPYFYIEGTVDGIPMHNNVEIKYMNESLLALDINDITAIKKTESYNISIVTERYSAKLQAKFNQRMSNNDCLFDIKTNDEESYRILLQIIHDGYNKQLPQKRDRWITTFDLLFDNINHRIVRLNSIFKNWRGE